MHVGQPLGERLLDVDLDQREIAAGHRDLAQRVGRLLDLLVFEEAADQLGARILGLGRVVARRPRQQHARLDLDQQRRHQQVVGRELELRGAHHLDVFHVLAREVRHRDVEDVERVPPDEVEEEIERALEGIEEDRERLGRNVEVRRKLREGLAPDLRDRHREVERGLLECGIVGGLRGHFLNSVSAACLHIPWTVAAGPETSSSSHANFTPSWLATVVAALKKFSPRSRREAPCFAAPSLLPMSTASGSLSLSPTITTTRVESALRTSASVAPEPTSDWGKEPAPLSARNSGLVYQPALATTMAEARLLGRRNGSRCATCAPAE